MKRFISKIIPYVMLAAILLIAARPLFDSRPLDGHDPGFNMIRLQQVHTLITHGTIIPRWAPDLIHGYGYPLFIFYPVLSYMVAEPFHALGMSLDASVKLGYFFGFIFAAFFMYLIGGALGSKNAGLIGASLYTLAPYRLLDVYVRVSYTEFFAMSLFPFIFWSFLRFAQTDRRCFALSALMGLIGLNLTHSISALLIYPLTFLWGLIVAFTFAKHIKRYFVIMMIVFVCAAGITAFFWIPALLERQYVQIDRMISDAFSFENHFISLAQLFSLKWGYPVSQKGMPQPMSFQIGWLHIIAVFMCVGCLYHASRRMRGVMIFILTGAVVSIFCMLPISKLVWDIIPMLAYIQFPWRILMVVSLLSSLAGVCVVVCLEKYTPKQWIWLICCAVIALYSLPYCKAQYIDEPLFSQAIEHNIRQLPLPYGSSTLLLEYLPRWALTVPEHPYEQLLSAQEGIAIYEQSVLPTQYQFTVRADKTGSLRVNTLYYPGWRCYIDDLKTKIKPVPETGIMEIQIQSTGTHRVHITFENTVLRKRAMWCSLLFCVIATLSLWWFKADVLR